MQSRAEPRLQLFAEDRAHTSQLIISTTCLFLIISSWDYVHKGQFAYYKKERTKVCSTLVLKKTINRKIKLRAFCELERGRYDIASLCDKASLGQCLRPLLPLLDFLDTEQSLPR